MKARTTPVHKLDLAGNILHTYNSIAEAEDDLDIFQTNIVQCCQGKRRTTGGYRWMYAEVKR